MTEYPYKISVVICTYNREQFLTGLMNSIVRQSMDRRHFEILFINNNSTDQTASLCQQFIEQYPNYFIRYFNESQQGLSFARNRGIREASGEYITFADDDALLAPDFLYQVCHYLDEHPAIAEVGGPVFLKYSDHIPKWRNPYMDGLFGYFRPAIHPYQMKKKSRRYPRGSNMTFRTAVFFQCGLFNPALGRIKKRLSGGEEKDIAFRLLDAGNGIAYIPEAIVYHLVPGNRTQISFVREQALGIGTSEHIRSKTNHEYPKRLFIEGLKWGATLLLWCRYSFTGQFAKANMLVRFRYWISKGLLFPIN